MSELRQRPGKGSATNIAPSTVAATTRSEPDSQAPEPEGNGPRASSDLSRAQDGGLKSGQDTRPFAERYERWMPLFVFAIAAFVRFYRLDSPTGVVFDESHFGRFTNQYTEGVYYFDIHPPLGKLTFWAVGQLAGYDYRPCNYTTIDTPYHADCKFMVLRATSALFGAATAPLFYQITRNFGGSVYGGLFSALLLVFDGINSEEARLILIDAQLLFYVAACLLVAQMWFRRWNGHCDALDAHERREAMLERRRRQDAAAAAAGVGAGEAVVRSPSSPAAPLQEAVSPDHGGAAAVPTLADSGSRNQRTGSNGAGAGAEAPTSLWARSSNLTPTETADLASRLHADARFMNWAVRLRWVVIMGVMCGNAVSVKFTGLATPAFIALESVFALLVLKRSYPFLDLVGILCVSFLTFSAYWWCHFALTPKTGDGDVFMFHEFQQSLIGNPHYDASVPKPPFWSTMLWLQKEMVVSNSNILEPHTWQSTWDEWVFNLRGLLMYSVDQGHTYTRAVYEIGNPLLIWFLFGVIVLSVVLLALWLRYRGDPNYRLKQFDGFFRGVIYCLALYALNLAPYLAVKRSCFIYHFMPALMYNQVLAGLVVGQLAGRRWAPFVLKALLTPLVLCYLFYAPWIYAFPLTNEGHDRRRWLPRWN